VILFELLERSLKDGVDASGKTQLDAFCRHYPYAALAHWIRAKTSQDKQACFTAAAYAPSRVRLRAYLQGQTAWVDPPAPAHSESDASMFPFFLNSPPGPASFRIGAETVDPEPVRRIPADQILAWDTPEAGPAAAALEQRIRQITRNFLPAIPGIQARTADSARSLLPPKAGRRRRAARLIDRFLEGGATLKPSRSPQDAPEEEHRFARQSLHADDAWMTETLAQLHIRQDNKAEALRIYQKLRLRFPEKSAYFEVRIQQLLAE
jgi:hypothetical protein